MPKATKQSRGRKARPVPYKKRALKDASTSTDLPIVMVQCCLCLNEAMVPVSTRCGHVFCKSCISAWLLPKEDRAPSAAK